jgi:prepilin peptidase CpaA
MDIAGLAAGALFVALLLAALLSDLRGLHIPNWVSLGLIAGFFGYVALARAPLDFGGHVAVAGIAFLAVFCLYVFGWFGGGDVKLLSAIMLWAGPQHGARFIAGVALAGGAVAILLVATGRILKAYPKTARYLPRRVGQWARLGVFPYSIPIVIGATTLLPAIFDLAGAAAPAK